MAAFDSKEYTRIRDIVQKRMKRAVAAGLMAPVHFPTVKEIKSGLVDPGQALRALQKYYSGGSQVKAIRQTGLVPEFRPFPELPKQKKLSPEERKQRRREQQRFYRQRAKVRKAALSPEKAKRYESYLKALATVAKSWGEAGVNIGINLRTMSPAQAQAFVEYMDYRFSQGDYKRKYVIDEFIQDFSRLMRRGHKPASITADFEKFLENRNGLADRAGRMEGISSSEFMGLWSEFE